MAASAEEVAELPGDLLGNLRQEMPAAFGPGCTSSAHSEAFMIVTRSKFAWTCAPRLRVLGVSEVIRIDALDRVRVDYAHADVVFDHEIGQLFAVQ